MSEREIRSCTTEDGVLIAYSVSGDGPPLLACHQEMESFTLDHLVTGQEDFFEQLGRGYCLIRYDPRGIGLSKRDIEDFSLDAAVRDLLAVIEATGFGRVSIFSPCWSTPDAMAFAARYPGRVERLILFSAFTSLPPFVRNAVGLIAQLWRTTPPMAAQTYADGIDRGAYPELCAQLATLFTQSIKSHDAAASIEQFLPRDVTDLQPQIQAPTLVIHRRGDRGNTTAMAQGRRCPHP